MAERKVRWAKRALGEYEGHLVRKPEEHHLGLCREPVAVAVKTGTHLDDYPWDWYLTSHGILHARKNQPGQPYGMKVHHAGVTDTLRNAKENVEVTLA